jgi:hypothetical protein
VTSPDDITCQVAANYPTGRNEYEGQRVQHLSIICHVAVGDQPRYRLYSITLRMKNQVLRMAPASNAHNHIWFEPAIIPFFFLR